MSKPLKIISLGLVVVLVIGLVAGVAFWTASTAPTDPEPGLYVNGDRVENPGAMLTVEGHEVSFEDYRHYYLVNKDAVAYSYGDIEWDNDPDGEKAFLMQYSTELELLSNYAWLAYAEQEGIELDDTDYEEINSTLESQKETYGAAFPQQLEQMHFADEAQYLRITEFQRLAQKAQTAYQDKLLEEEGDKLFEETVATAKHILISAGIITDVNQAGPNADTARTAENMYKQIMQKEDPAAAFEDMRLKYDEDTEGQPEEGYTFGEGQMEDAFYKATMKLTVGEISKPVASSYGYHIIMRVPLNTEETEGRRDELIANTITRLVNEKTEELRKALTVEEGAYYSALDKVSNLY
ncbi:MAG: peptidylprolyl isomerase [Oscillospiraceae bacterium]